jgi:hypothetical protein
LPSLFCRAIDHVLAEVLAAQHQRDFQLPTNLVFGCAHVLTWF